MGQGITVTRGFGWVVDRYDGDWVTTELSELVDTGSFDYHALNKTMFKEQGIDCEFDAFGYSFGAIALVARASTLDAYDWEHEWSKLAPSPMDVAIEGTYRAELYEALEALGWRGAQLGEPKWLLLVTYG